MNASSIVFNAFLPLLSDKDIKFEDVGTESMPIPSFPLALIKDLLKEAESFFSNETSNIAYTDGDIYIIGDIHGNIRDLIRIIASASLPPNSRYLFLGDYVDRGDYSLESISLLLALALKFPHHVILLRGNHEYDSVNSKYGFMEQVIALYGQSGVYESFNRVFSYFKIAAIVADTTLCLHGGLSPRFSKLSQLEEIDRTLNPPCELLNDIMWSDPSEVTDAIIPSTRGYGCMFGYKFLCQFLANNNLIRIIRGHECVKNGVKVGLDSKIITVFSSCNYTGEGSNECGIIKILIDGDFKAFNLQGIPILHREDAVFKKVYYEQTNQKINCMILNSPSMNKKLQKAKRASVSHISLCGSCMRMKTMSTKKSNSKIIEGAQSLPKLANSSSILCDANNTSIGCSILNDSKDEDDDQPFGNSIDDERIDLQNLSYQHRQTRSPQIKKPLRSISKSQSFF